MAEKLRFIYVPTGYEIPDVEEMDANAIYFGEADQELWVNKHRIANYLDSASVLHTIGSTYKIKDLGDPVDDGESHTNLFVSEAEIGPGGEIILYYKKATFVIEIENPEHEVEPDVVSPTSNTFDVITDLHASGESITPVYTTVTLDGFASSGDVDDALEEAKQYTNDAVSGLTKAMHFIGVSSTVIEDGESQIPTIDGVQVIPKLGDVVVYLDAEFVWDGSKWSELGTASSFVLQTQRVVAGTGLTGGGALTSDVTLNHAVAKTASFDRIEQVISSDGHASDWDSVSGNGNVRISLIREVAVDSLGHVTSVQYQDVTTYIVQLVKYLAEKIVEDAIGDISTDVIEDAMREAVREANRYTDAAIEAASIDPGSARWATEQGSGGSESSESNPEKNQR